MRLIDVNMLQRSEYEVVDICTRSEVEEDIAFHHFSKSLNVETTFCIYDHDGAVSASQIMI